MDKPVGEFADWLVTAVFGGTYQRDGLSPRDRQLVNLAATTIFVGNPARAFAANRVR